MDEATTPRATEYAELDVSTWPRSGREELGTKPKRWLMNPNTQEHWLMKYATVNEPHGSPGYRKGDDWAERVACGVAVFKALEDILPPPSVEESLSAWDAFVGYLTLDALIGNTDRHEENWSAIKPVASDSERRLAPTFDHASSLGFQLSDEQKQARLVSSDRNYTPEGWADRARTRFAGKPHPIEVVEQASEFGGRPAIENWLDRIQRVDDLIAPIWAIPEHRMSAVSKVFAERMLRRNWSRLSS